MHSTDLRSRLRHVSSAPSVCVYTKRKDVEFNILSGSTWPGFSSDNFSSRCFSFVSHSKPSKPSFFRIFLSDSEPFDMASVFFFF